MLALTPGIGDIDIVLASELMEAGRAVANGFVTPDRTLVIASTSRFYAINEKIAMGDGRYDQERLTQGDRRQRAGEPAHRHGGAGQGDRRADQCGDAGRRWPAAAGCRFRPKRLAAAIRADGKAVDSNLAGFRAGLAAARDGNEDARRKRQAARGRGTVDLDTLESEIAHGARRRRATS